jgi:uncharacterized protein YybS (DUF2232 family)
MGDMLGLDLPTLVLIVGIFFVVVGIIVAGVVYRESREWKKMVLPMFDRESTEMEPESPKEADGLTPRLAAFGKEIFGRFFSQMEVAGLLNGAVIVILGVLIVLIGLTLGS